MVHKKRLLMQFQVSDPVFDKIVNLWSRKCDGDHNLRYFGAGKMVFWKGVTFGRCILFPNSLILSRSNPLNRVIPVQTVYCCSYLPLTPAPDSFISPIPPLSEPGLHGLVDYRIEQINLAGKKPGGKSFENSLYCSAYTIYLY